MQLIITLCKDVADREEGEQLYELVKMKLVDRPDIKVAGHVTNHFPESEEHK